ncbi:uncharacterized protein LOC119650863 [Hermetia illucens]|uniref:uncharacterized protein LOC119650863 n=1 Tax=Hermetia illucens TaxID=343691 RepID=UPI0018CC664A|nr:uncharacterized protein LOC119650863 [Hermetia illucens]
MENDEELYMEVPATLKEALEDIIRSERRDSSILPNAAKMHKSLAKGNQACTLRKAIYGLKQSGKKWYKRLSAVLRKLGLKPKISDPCLFQRRHGRGILLLAVYVDYLIVTSNNEKLMEDLKKGLKQKFQMNELGEAKYCPEITQENGRELESKEICRRTSEKIRHDHMHTAEYTSNSNIKVESSHRTDETVEESTLPGASGITNVFSRSDEAGYRAQCKRA